MRIWETSSKGREFILFVGEVGYQDEVVCIIVKRISCVF